MTLAADPRPDAFETDRKARRRAALLAFLSARGRRGTAPPGEDEADRERGGADEARSGEALDGEARADGEDLVRRRSRSLLTSPLTRRILAVNVLALLLLVAGLLYLGEYRRGLVQAELDSLAVQGALIANGIAEGAISDAVGGRPGLSLDTARQMVRRLSEPTGARLRLFAEDGSVIADSRLLTGPGGTIVIERLPPPVESGPFGAIDRLYAWIAGLMPSGADLPAYDPAPQPLDGRYPEVALGRAGEVVRRVRHDADDRLVLNVAVPVQRYKEVLGVVLLTLGDTQIEKALRSVRYDILKVFAATLAVTVLLSIYLAGTIARPIRRLARGADRVRHAHGRPPAIPDLGRRRDEIGDLGKSLAAMTETLWKRLNANERFAADVAHEIKNPLTSLRSAVETAARIEDPEQQRRLMAIIQDDVDRLDRLISDISDASRLDAELSRDESERVDVGHLLEALAELHTATAGPDDPRFRLEIAGHHDLTVSGLESRLGQVFRNLIANAISFSPAGGTITLRAGRTGRFVMAAVEDEGPGVPEDKREAIFGRFYSERPSGEKFGTHSGLGLSISRQIVEAHGGRIRADNRLSQGRILGARFVVRLPAERA